MKKETQNKISAINSKHSIDTYHINEILYDAIYKHDNKTLENIIQGDPEKVNQRICNLKLTELAIDCKNTQALEILVGYGASLNNYSGEYSLLERAFIRQSPECIKVLIKTGKIKLDDYKDKHALLRAVENSYWDIVDILISAKDFNIHIKDKNGANILHYLSQYSNVELLERVLKMKLDINAVNNEGSTPLHIAIKGGHLDVSNALIKFEANSHIKDNKGFTSQDIAGTSDNNLIRDLFKKPIKEDVQTVNLSITDSNIILEKDKIYILNITPSLSLKNTNQFINKTCSENISILKESELMVKYSFDEESKISGVVFHFES
jgi:hypothetical protein